jgi:hypothetical protein
MAVDPTTITMESSAGFEEEQSVDVVAQIQELSMTHRGIPQGNDIAANGKGAIAELATALTAAGVAGQPISPPQPPPAPQPIPVAPPPPFPPIPITRRNVSGSYRSAGPAWQVELRCDVDGRHPLRHVSADYYTVSGATVHYFGSMRVDAPVISVTNTTITVTGIGTYTWSAGFPKVQVTIPRTLIFQPPAAATLQHLSLSNIPGANYACTFASHSFRTVLLEQDRQDTVGTPFVSYDTGSLPSGGPARALTIPAAYAEAGIEMQSTGRLDVVNTSEAGNNTTWSDAELHAAMERHFSFWRDLPQWAVWLFHAQLHDFGPNLLGIMFDQQGRQRQGAAVFYERLAGTTPDRLRSQLYTCVHELGHCFNLLHSWQKSLATPPGVDRLRALSWMNYPDRFPDGEAAFWSAFGFQFDDQELIHLRHAFRDEIIMGGNDFGIGAALEVPEGWRNPQRDDSGLKLELEAPDSFPFGAPVSVKLKLSLTDTRGKRIHPSLKPSSGFVEVAIRQPDNTYRIYHPMIQRCLADSSAMLSADRPEVSTGAFIGYGLDGFYFDKPGFYYIRTRYYAPDGSVVLSNIQRIQVQQPLSRDDEKVASLFFDNEVGTLSSLMGSDYNGLQRGNDALSEVREKYPKHPLADYASLIQGVNEARAFKDFGPDNYVKERKAKPEEASKLLKPVIDVTAMPKATAAMKTGTPEHVQKTARSLEEATARRKLSPDLEYYIQARKWEIATEISGITQMSST